MYEETTIQLKEWNSESSTTQLTGESVSVYTIAKSMTPDNFVKLFDEYLNLGAKDFRSGKEVGLKLRTTHRSLQRLAICFACGVVAGLAEQVYTDPRNETAIETAKKVAEMIKNNELPFGLFI
ncbi:MAG: hypothetical protein AB9897_03460 [Anaerolineaceae bacterium]